MKISIQDNVEEFIQNLQPTELAKVLHTIELLEMFGNELGLPHSRHMKDGLLELRVPGKRAIRVMYCFHKNEVILLHAFFKKTQQTPTRDIDTARLLMKRL